jgi:hypothetical protein
MPFAAAVAVVAGLAAFGPPAPLLPHGRALQAAEARATNGDWDTARAVLDAEAANALPEAAELLRVHAQMLARLQQLEATMPGLGRRYVPYVFAPEHALLPDAAKDLRQLAGVDDALQTLCNTPATVTVDHERRAVALLVRGALLDRARAVGLPLHAAGGDAVVHVTLEQEDVERRDTILEGTGMHSYTTYVALDHARNGYEDITNGVVVQLLGINEARAIDTNLDRVVDRVLTGLVVEWIRRALLGDLGA